MKKTLQLLWMLLLLTPVLIAQGIDPVADKTVYLPEFKSLLPEEVREETGNRRKNEASG